MISPLTGKQYISAVPLLLMTSCHYGECQSKCAEHVTSVVYNFYNWNLIFTVMTISSYVV